MVSFKRGGSAVEADAQAPEGIPAVATAPVMAPSAAFPRVNLIPEQVAIEARTQTAKRVCIASVAAAAVVVGGLWFLASGQVSSAQNELDTATARSAALAAEATKYSDVPRVNTELAAAQVQLASAMGGEVRWSVVLNNLALSTPTGVSLDSFKAVVNGTAPGAAAAAQATSTTASSTSVMGTTGIGTMDFQGTATDWGHVASFLDTITRTPGVIDPWATQVTDNSAGGASSTTDGDKFTAGAAISDAALSHRFDAKGN